MKFFDPSRPTINGHPAYLSPKGKPIAPLPPLSIQPYEGKPDHVIVACHLVTGANVASFRSSTVPVSQLPTFWDAWLEDPESLLLAWFHYSYEPQANVPVKGLSISLGDLGL